jgi:hypothetical protein
MSIRKLALVVATAAAALLSVGLGSASATTLRTDPGGQPFATGNVTVTNTSSGTATLTTSLGNLDCTNTKFVADINNNHAETLTGSLTQLTFTSCTDTIPFLTISSCHQHGPNPDVRVTSTGANTGSVNLSDVGVRCIFTTGGACYFTAATANGVANNSASTISYTNVAASGITGTSDNLGALCPSSGTFSTVLNHIVESGTNRTVTVTAS